MWQLGYLVAAPEQTAADTVAVGQLDIGWPGHTTELAVGSLSD